MGEEAVGCVGQNEGRGGWSGWSLVVFFGATKKKRERQRSRAQETRCKNKTRGGQACISDGRVRVTGEKRERNTIYKTEKDHRGKIVTSLVVGNRIEKSVRRPERYGETSESTRVHSTHTHGRGRNS